MAKTKVVQKNAYIWHSGLKGSTIFKRLFYNDVTTDVALVFNTKVTENRITSTFFFFFFPCHFFNMLQPTEAGYKVVQ